MRSPAVRWLILCFTCVWFGALAPGHQRGQIQLPGWSPAERCCPVPAAAAAACHVGGGEQHPTCPTDPAERPGGACAVCYVVACLQPPPPLIVYVPEFGPAPAAPAARLHAAVVAPLSLPIRSRAPPAA